MFRPILTFLRLKIFTSWEVQKHWHCWLQSGITCFMMIKHLREITDFLEVLSCGTTAQSGLGRLIIEVSWLHTIRDTLTKLLWTSDQFVAETASYTTNARDELQCPQRDSNPRSKLTSDRRSTPFFRLISYNNYILNHLVRLHIPRLLTVSATQFTCDFKRSIINFGFNGNQTNRRHCSTHTRARAHTHTHTHT
jgi:hypothetical protein